MTLLMYKRKKAISLLDVQKKEGQDILLKTEKIQSEADYNNLLDEHEIWWNSTGNLLRQMFNDEAISRTFLYVGFFIPKQRILNQKIKDFRHNIEADLIKIEKIKSDIKNGIYKGINHSEFSYEGITASLKRNRIIAIVLLVFFIITGIAEGVHKIYEAKNDIAGENATEEKIKLSDLSISASFMKKDSSYDRSLNDNEIKGILQDNISLEKKGDSKVIKLKFTFSDEILKKYIAFKFNFGLDFYKQLGGDKLYPDGWMSAKLGSNNRCYVNEPGTFNQCLIFETNYIGKK